MAAVILAAGSSTRLGQPKQLLPLDGRPLLQHVVDAAHQSRVDEVVVVLGYAADEIRAALSLPPGARTVANPHFADGQATSLVAGIDALGDDVGAALILLGDQPGMLPRDIDAVVASHQETGALVVRAAYGGTAGHPVLFMRAAWADLRAVDGDRGARDLMAAHPEWVATIDLEGGAPPDVDTWDDYRRLS